MCGELIASVIGQVSLSGTAVAALHRELRSPGATRKVIRPVKSPSPARRAAAQGPLAPQIRDIQSQRVLFQAVVGGASSTVGEEEFEDWEPQVGLTIFLSHPFIITGCGHSPKLSSLWPIICCHFHTRHKDSSSSLLQPSDSSPTSFLPSLPWLLSFLPSLHPHLLTLFFFSISHLVVSVH